MYKDGIKDGRWIEWNQNSEEIINGFYKNNVPWRGQFENFFYSDGRIAQEYNEYFENGEKKITGTFVNNKKSGEWIEWFSNGQKKYIGNFLNGNRHGSWVEWDESGNEIIDGEYKSGQKWNGQFGGKNYVSGLLRQDFVEKYPSGALKSSGVLINEVKIGQWSFWYENEVIKESGFFTNDIKDGEWEGYYESGNKKFIGNFNNGKKDGNWIQWYDDTLKQSEGSYNLGIKNGEWIEWDDKGKVIVSITYIDGEKWTGRYKEIFYLEGVEKKGVVINYPDGQVKEEGIIFNDTKVGRWTEYFDNGKRKNTGLYIAGKEHGKWYYWYKSCLLYTSPSPRDQA